MPDPILKEAMEEIKAVLAKHDLAAVVLLAGPAHMEWFYELSPTWSCAKLTGDQMRIHALRSEYPTLEAHKKIVTETVGLVFGFVDVCKKATEDMSKVAIMLGHHMDIQHWSRDER